MTSLMLDSHGSDSLYGYQVLVDGVKAGRTAPAAHESGGEVQ